MNEVTLFTHPDFGNLRTIVIDNELWFVGKEVCDTLGYSNTRDALAKHVDEEDKGVAKCDTLGGKQDVVVINEAGVYSLIFSSKLPAAKSFKHWVTHEVLPSIRKQGFYSTLTDDKLIELLQERKKNNPNYVKELMQKEKTVTKELKDQTREKRLEETVEIWRRYFDKHEEIDVPKELKRIWRGDMPMFHKYLDKFHVDESKQAKGKIIIV